MKKIKDYKSIQKKPLILSTLLAFAIHIALIGLIIQTSTHSSFTPLSYSCRVQEQRASQSKSTTALRNQQLTSVFNRLLAKSISPQNVGFELSCAPHAFVEPTLNPSSESISLKTWLPQTSAYEPTLSEIAINAGNLDKEGSFSFEQLDTLKSSFQPSSFLDQALGEFDEPNSINSPSIQLNEPTVSKSFEETLNKEHNPYNKGPPKSSDFIVQVEYSPTSKGEGFLFKMRLLAKPHKKFKRIPQKIFFLIDRSHSISPKNFLAAKQAVLKAIQLIHPEDEFNILLFDRKVCKLSKECLAKSIHNIELAHDFLEHQKHGGFFASTDLYTSLDKIIPPNEDPKVIHTAILLSDGDTFIPKEKQRKTLYEWTLKNHGKTSLFSLAIGKRKNIALLDLLSTFNKGSLKSVHTPEDISKQLCEIVASLNSPIAKNLVVTLYTHQIQPKEVHLHPKPSRLPDLYEHLEYVLYGSMSEHCDFTVFFQGESPQGPIDIKKSVSLKEALLSEQYCLKKNLLLQEAYHAYEKYLKSSDEKHLTQVKELLSPLKLPVAFE